MKSNQHKHGGKRIPGPGKTLGPKPSPFPERLKKFRATDEEWAEFLLLLPDDAREASTLVFNAVKKFLGK